MVQVTHGDSGTNRSPRLVMSSQLNLEKSELNLDKSEQKDVKMANFDDLPLEIKEVIFLFLSPRDLKQCSLVCMRWYEIVNSNRIWLKICEVQGLSKKKELQDHCSMIQNPMKHYTYDDDRLAPSRWRSHFNRYRFVQRNWKEGYFVIYSLPIKPFHLDKDYIIEHVESKLIVSKVHGQVEKFCSIDLILPDLAIETIMSKDNYLIYIQNRNVICLKKSTNTFKKVIQVALEEGNCNQPRNNCIKSPFTMRLTDRFILIQDPLNPCILCFFETNSSSSRRYVDLHKALGNQSLFCSCFEVIGNRVFLGYRMGLESYIAQYDYSKDVWEEPTLLIPSRAVELYISQKFVCAKLNTDSREQHYNHTSNLYVWSLDLRYKVGEFCANKHVPVLLTENDMMIYSFRDEIIVRQLCGSYEKSFSVSPTVLNISRVWNKYLVLHDDRGISIWDSTTGRKVVSPLRTESCVTVCVSDTNVLLKCEDNRFVVVSFW